MRSGEEKSKRGENLENHKIKEPDVQRFTVIPWLTVASLHTPFVTKCVRPIGTNKNTSYRLPSLATIFPGTVITIQVLVQLWKYGSNFLLLKS